MFAALQVLKAHPFGIRCEVQKLTKVPMGVTMERADKRRVVQFMGALSERTLGKCLFESTPDIEATSDIRTKNVEDS